MADQPTEADLNALDVTDAEAAKAVIRQAVERFGRLDELRRQRVFAVLAAYAQQDFMMHHLAVAQTHHEVLGRESESPHEIDRQGNGLSVSLRRTLANDVRVELQKLA